MVTPVCRPPVRHALRVLRLPRLHPPADVPAIEGQLNPRELLGRLADPAVRAAILADADLPPQLIPLFAPLCARRRGIDTGARPGKVLRGVRRLRGTVSSVAGL